MSPGEEYHAEPPCFILNPRRKLVRSQYGGLARRNFGGPLFYYYRRRRHGALRKDASSGSSLLRFVMRSEAWPALQRPHGIYYLLFRQASARTAFALGVDASRRRVACRAVCPAVQTNRTPPKEALFISIRRMALKPFLRFRASRPGLFYDLSAGDSCPLRIPLAPSTGSGLGAAVSPADKSGKGRRPPASHSEKASKPFSCLMSLVMSE
jgi:hypothetical protein